MRVRVKIDADVSMPLEKLLAMKARSKNLRPLFEYARVQLGKSNAENFALGGLPSGKKWDKRTQPYPWPLMIRTGKLMESLTSLFGPPNRIGLTTATFGTDVEYAKFHQYGTTKMPARKILFEPRGFSRDLADKAAQYITEGII